MRRICSLLLPALLCGCETFHGFPERPNNIAYPGKSADVQGLVPSEQDALNAYHGTDPAKRLNLTPRQYRDAFIYAELGAVNDKYDDFLANVHANRSTFNIVTSGTVLALNGIAATTGGAGTKAALSAASAGIVGQTGAIDRELFNTEALVALIARMEAARLAALVPIKQGMAQDIDRYPLEAALVDLHAYRKAGNLLTTLNSVATDAGQQARASQETIDRVVRGADYKLSLATKQALQTRMDKLDDRQVIALVWAMNGQLAFRPAELQADLGGANPSGSRFRTPAAARAYLAEWLDKEAGSANEMSEWNSAITLAEKN